MRRWTYFVVGTAMLMPLLPASSGRADITPGIAGGSFQCQIELPVFPALIPASATPHECKGAAIGNAGGHTNGDGKDALQASFGIPSFFNKKANGDGEFVNMKLYDILYVDTCLASDAPSPALTIGLGHILVNSTGVPGGTPGSMIAHFNFARVGIAWVASLDKAETDNASYAGQATGGPVPDGTGTGVAAGILLVKPVPTPGTCASPGMADIFFVGSYFAEVSE